MAQGGAPRVPITPIDSTGSGARNALTSPLSEAQSRLNRTKTNPLAALSSFALDLRDMQVKADLQRDRIKSVQSEADFLADADARVAKIDPLKGDYQDQVKLIYEDGRLRALEKADLRTPEARAHLEERLTRIGGAGQITAAGMRRQALENESLRTSDVARDATLAKIRKDPDGFVDYLGEFEAQQAQLNQGITPEKVRARAQAFGDQAIAAKIEGLAEKGRIGDARKVLDVSAKDIPQELYRTLFSRIKTHEAQLRADGERYSAQRAATTEAEIQAGGKIDPKTGEVIPGSAAPTLYTIEADRAAGKYALNPEKYVQHRRMIMAVEAQGAEEARKDLQAQANAKAGTVSSQDEANRAWEVTAIGRPVGSRRTEGGDPSKPLDENTMMLAERFVAQTGWVPDQIKLRIENAERIGAGADPQRAAALVAQAAMVADRLEKAAPKANIKIGERVQAVRTAVAMDGVSYDDAARQVIAQTPSDEKVVADRRKNFATLDKDTNWTSTVSGEFSRGVIAGVLQQLPGVANYGSVLIPPELANTAKELAERNYILTNDLDRAKKMTLEQLKKDYGVSTVGGRPQVVKYPPERYFPPEVGKALDADPQLRRSVIDEQVVTRLQEAGIKPGANPAAAGLPPYRLQADDTTASQIREGRLPSYRVQVLDATGMVYVDVANTKGGSARYTVPTAEEVKQTGVWKELMAKADAAERKRREEEASPRRTGAGPRIPPVR